MNYYLTKTKLVRRVLCLACSITLTHTSFAEDYEFQSQFNDQSSVSYTGQTLRLSLIKGLKGFMNSVNRQAFNGSEKSAMSSLESYFAYNSQTKKKGKYILKGSKPHKITAKGLDGNSLAIEEGKLMNSIYSSTPSKNLKEKIAGNDPESLFELKGWASNQVAGVSLSGLNYDNNNDSVVEPDDLVKAFFTVWAENTQKAPFALPYESETIKPAYITESGLDLTQLTEKFLHGAVVFSQIANDYLSYDTPGKGINADNTKASESKSGRVKNYTALEHHWDEAFGYFGVARNFLDYKDEDHKSSKSIDTNKDGKISIHTEKSLGSFSKNASRFDFISEEICKQSGSSQCQPLTLSEDIYNAFYQGRKLITEKTAGYQSQLEELSDIIVTNIEKTIAATTIHYINVTLQEMDQFGTDEYKFISHSKFWSEMKGFAMAFQFNRRSLLSPAEFDTLHELMRDQPVLMSESASDIAGYKTDLKQALDILVKAFGFDPKVANKL